MIGKVLFTLGVILVVVLIWRTRRPRQAQLSAPPRLVNPPRRRQLPWRALAFVAVAVMLAASVFLVYDHWRDSNEEIFVKVVDAGSGRVAEYRARRGDIGEREFVTTDGRHVVLAASERLETVRLR
jgi:hypothetical protein